MTTDDLKDQLISIWQRISEKVQETQGYQQLKERFDSFTPQVQKLIVKALGLLVFLVMLSFPYTWWSESQELAEKFDSRRKITRELFKVSREVSETPNLSPVPDASTLASDLTQRTRQGNLIEEQIKGIDANAEGSRIIPVDKSEGSYEVRLEKLNITQFVNIGTSLTNLNSSVKMTGLEITADKSDPRYFNVVYKLTALKVPSLNNTNEASE